MQRWTSCAVDPARTPADIGADRGSGDSTTGRRDVLPTTAADLVPEHAADDRANDRARYVRRRLRGLDDLLALDPAALLRRTNHYATECTGTSNRCSSGRGR